MSQAGVARSGGRCDLSGHQDIQRTASRQPSLPLAAEGRFAVLTSPVERCRDK